MILRFQAAALLLVFLTASLLGQTQVQFCKCAGVISIGAETECSQCECYDQSGRCETHDVCDKSSDCEKNAPADLPRCEYDDCWVILSAHEFGSLAKVGVRNLSAPAAPAQAECSSLESVDAPKVIKPLPILPPPDPPGVPLNVLYASLLI